MRYLFDTHTMLWISMDHAALTQRIRDLFADETNQIYLSAASLWEMAVKISLKKLVLPCKLQEFIEKEVIGNNVELLPVKPAHTYELESLPFYHRDPFDRLLIAQTRFEGLTLVSKDEAMRQYGIQVLW